MPDTPTEKRPFLLRPRSKKPKTGKAKADWLVMAYLAADNDLEGELLADLAEMERVGSHPGVVDVLAQVDRSAGHNTSKGNWHGTRRYYVTRGADPRRIHSRLLADLGPTNTGDPGVLESYIRFGAQRYPARATALVLMNHGSGFYVPPEMLSRGEKLERGSASPAQRRRRRPFFHTTQERLLGRPVTSRGIAYDYGAGDCLDNQELKRVLARAQRLLGRKVDVVGMDACLMTMLEVAYQLKDHAKVLVGSEELEPGAGWPHSSILADLTKNPKMTPAELGATVVQRYVQSYRHRAEEATQSAIDLGQIGGLVDAVDLLARRVLANIKNAALVAALHGARRRTLQFFDGLYVDLHHLAGNLATASGLSSITDACRDVQRVIQGQEGRGPVIAEGHVGARLAPARGLSIYCPVYPMASVHYGELEFAKRTAWADLLEVGFGSGR
jgi:hypothetical protein